MKDPNLKRLALPLVAFVVSLAVGLYLVGLSQSVRTKESRLVRQQIATGFGFEIERRLTQSIASTYILKQELIRSHGHFEDFETFAQSILDQFGNITNLQLAPGGVVRRIHPVAGSEAALGHDILRDDKRRNEAIAAVESGQLTLAGPFALLQGGVAVIARNPVYLAGEGADGRPADRFWGFTSALIMLEDLIDPSWIDTLRTEGYDYRLQRFDPYAGGVVVFGGDPELDTDNSADIDIVVPNDVWTLSIGHRDAGIAAPLLIELVVALLLSLALAAYCRRVVEEPIELRRLVAEQTRDLHELAYRDELTGLSNRNQFLLTLSAELSRVGPRCPLALMLLDLDHFKDVNDILGHDVGDRLLVEAARRMTRCLPPGAELARLGGDEFTVIVRGEDPLAQAKRLSRRVIAVIDEPFLFDGHEANVSASIGIATPGRDRETVTDLLKCADQAMYEAKNNGRGDLCVFDASMREALTDRARMIADLRLALHNESEFELLYQPIVCAVTGRITKAETLIRWNHPENGLISPTVFIPLAEYNGMMDQIGEWVFTRAVEQAARWRRELDPTFQISVNVSPVQLRTRDIVSGWTSIVTERGLDPSAVLIEITEGVLLGDSEHGKAQLRQLRLAGFEVALDDFGTGYSSLSYLKELEVDYLKIDRSFIQRLEADSDDLALCHAIIALARRFGLQVVAEGVETREQESLLNAERCDYLQGYLYSRPVDADTFEERFLAHRLGLAA